ncbi:uroporphyrinogen-III C-methyltransferase [Desulfosarcina sp.]|uniref:uroporphyrinogen-III C-methyltransferase n=1 Tax=Desulfosarcina sp. TaxID=2027861 RepID=UPI0029B6B6A9|nr:uroporphyrinogen-III C-methyltransferase [Desulfosarcina sp.]MDX2452977.1 uroporphyrinogen-III C-methyltransferase [Desulfosarcina sp.]MDX2490712.1 uroporphyrinogen-III C-methyltransferase [Desulfosarcina sp.]
MHSNNETGKVFLVGAGPGDPGLITVKGADCIARADVVVYDYLASPTLLAHANPDAEMIYVGKKGGDHTLPQDGINALIVEKAKQGNVVARLKGGDPFIFGRGGEEAEVLIAAGIPFEVVPGVTAAIGASAYAGIPLTHRDYTSDVAFVTGHEDPTKAESSVNWKALATGIGTLVFFMGVKNLPAIAANLVANGRSADTPAAVIRWGTTPKQKTVTATLGTIVEETRRAGIKAPAIIIVGGVVNLRKTMQWFEKRPLMGRRIVVTRAREQASGLVQRLTEYGAECIQCPTIQVGPPPDWAGLDRAIETIGQYSWIVFTSVNGVDYFFRRLFENGLDVRALGHIKTAAIGPATADRLRTWGLKSDIIPESYRAESVVEAFSATPVKGSRILLPRAMEARSVLPVELTRMGAMVDEVTAYETRQAENSAADLIARLTERTIDMVTFTSSSTVKNFHRLLPPDRVDRLMKGVSVASIGPITSQTARDLGFSVTIEADTYTVPGLIQAILNHQA